MKQNSILSLKNAILFPETKKCVKSVLSEGLPESIPVLETLLHTHCLRCGKPLQDLDSKVNGYGPTCYQKVLSESRQSKKLF